MDKNTIIGFVLIAAVLIGYGVWSQPSAEERAAMAKQDSINNVVRQRAEFARKEAQEKKLAEESNRAQDTTALFYSSLKGKEEKIKLKNKSIEVTLNTKGGTPEKVVVKNFPDYKKNPDVTLFDKKDQNLKFILQAKETNINTSNLYFTPSDVTDSTVTMTAIAGSGKDITIKYTLGKDYMLPDCFGFPRNFPTVLKHCGIVGFSTQKLTWGSAVGIPFEIGRWRGDDGSELICALNPGEYVGRLKTTVDKDKNRLKKLYALGGKNGVWKSFQYYGTGDIGGAPDEKSVVNFIKSAEYYDKNGGGIKIAQGAADEFFKGLTEEEVAKLDVYEGDLLLVKHSAGSLSSQANMKRFNRRNEQLAIAAEYISLVARNIARAEYPKERIEKNWQRVIGNQMHAILPGTCTPTAYEYSYNDEILAMKEWAQIIEDGLARIAPHIKGGGDILIFNPCECARNTVSEMGAPLSASRFTTVKLGRRWFSRSMVLSLPGKS